MSKPMLVTLPFVLLLLDYWPLERFELHFPTFLKGVGGTSWVLETDSNSPPFLKGGRGDFKLQVSRSSLAEPVSAKNKKGKSAKRHIAQAVPPFPVTASTFFFAPHNDRTMIRLRVKKLLLEKLPLFALAALSCVITFIAQQKGGAIKSLDRIPLDDRIANAFVSYVTYIGKTIWPHNLAIFYPHPGSLPAWRALGALILLIALTFVAVWKAERFPYLRFGWLWFTGTLIPVIGIVQVGGQAMADRYTYLPLIGLFIMGAWGVPELLQRWRYCNVTLLGASVLTLSSFFVLTWTHVGYWSDSITLYDHALEVTAHNYRIHNNRGLAYADLDLHRQAIFDFGSAVEINPGDVKAYLNRGVSYAKLGDHRQAISDFSRAIGIDPGYVQAYFNRGVAYGIIGDTRQAISDYSKVVEIAPKEARAFNDRGIAYGKLGDYQKAVEDFDTAVRLDPGYAEAYYNRAVAYDRLGVKMRAEEDVKIAAKLGWEEAKEILRNRVHSNQELKIRN